MKRITILTALLLLFCCAHTFAQKTLQVKGRFLYTPTGEKLILRGVNEMFIWSDDLTGEQTFPEIAKTGANVVRIVWQSSDENPRGTAAMLDQAITNCIAAGMIPMPELHGATGKWDKLQSQVDYWVKPEVLKVLKKHEPYLLLNIANEVGGHEVSNSQFKEGYEKAISRMRAAGIKCPLVIDAASWGQSIDMLQATGPHLMQQDPLQNLLFSVHMWWTAPDGATDRIKNEIKESVAQQLPLIVGEFAPMGVGCAKSIDYKTIMEQCQQHEIGWLAWSWGLQDNGDCKLMDMTNDEERGKFSGLFSWGLEVAVTDPNSIKNTSRHSEYIRKWSKELARK
ncbi:glycoside hydrolase family 5 protein [Cesiribacter sp. SM1]|uniref:glycoside hydrolase family 5 protein n=1 Tax=Cesiribacter sp. SM1 TaxID=2861196 RepID=UPI001CD36B46|nr:cellulase family glycosylhydrolase [Cesiribacter sp. SM1]